MAGLRAGRRRLSHARRKPRPVLCAQSAAVSMVPLAALTSIKADFGPGIHDALQPVSQRADQRLRRARLQFRAGHEGAGGSLRARPCRRNGLRLSGHSFQEKKAQQGVSPAVIFGLSLLFVFLILAALYESWSCPSACCSARPSPSSAPLRALIWSMRQHV